MKVLVTGATGYVGGRLVPDLLDAGHEVRVLVRDPERAAGLPWIDRVEVAVGDLLAPESLPGAFEGIEAAYYLVHSMQSGSDFADRDRRAALHFRAAAAHLHHVVYLGGLLPPGAAGEHLSSRAEVGALLAETLPVTELRAGPVIGSGSASFEMVRYLTERLPVMIAPRWVRNAVQPIAVHDVLAYLVLALERGPCGVVEIGAAPMTFEEMMLGYAAVRGIRRVILPVPVLAPRLAALWVGLVTPIPNSLAVPLIKGIVNPVLADTRRARALFPEVEPLDYRTAVRRALARVEAGEVETRWSGALGDGPTYRLTDWEGLIQEEHSVLVDAPAARVFATFSGLGGARGWLVWRWAWEVRGILDRLVGGPGLRRGRRHPDELRAAEALDFWRVEAVEPPRLLRLRAEMKVPGRAWLQFEAAPRADGRTRLVQTALFAPRGITGTLYWYLLYPIHWWIFRDLVRAVAREARRAEERSR